MEQMSSMERVLATIRGEETDRVPVCSLAVGVARKVSGCSFPEFSMSSESAAEAMILTNQLVGDDIILCFTDLSVEAADFGQEMIYPDQTTAHPNYDNLLVKTPGDYSRLKRFKADQGRRMSTYLDLCGQLVSRVGQDVPILGFIYGPLGVLGMLRGMENLYRDILECPENVKEGLEIVTDVLVDFVRGQFGRGVAGVCIDTLPASRSGVMPNVWEEFEGVYAKRIKDEIVTHGVLNAHHGCGFSPYFKEVRKWLEPAVLSFADVPEDCSTMAEAKEKYGRESILMGCVPTELLYSGTPADVVRESVRQIDLLGSGGNFILAPTCEFPPNGDLLNARAMVTAAEQYSSIRARQEELAAV
ncbi:uroporphyrinogen decarboxylase family protein [Desulfosediminicola flagellatus]|uniref:uroporphyrinogen decarboxylase family protein n=1 Tax=Desulfosediminicola flagellatus TaxID=2569541 RepID=UPI0010AB6CB5|nr:uroporphyrinogen decarboxylase family protein [Desulfosediminicola flagellatus]